MKYFYAATNAYSTENSIGLDDTWFILAFKSKKERDNYVAESDKLATRAISRKDLTMKYSPRAGFGIRKCYYKNRSVTMTEE